MAETSSLTNLTSPKVISTVILTAGLLTMTALTIKDFLPLLDEYRSNNIATQVQVARDSNFTPPQLALGVPFYDNCDSLMVIAKKLMNESKECDICRQLEKEGWDIWNDVDLSKFKDDGLQSLYYALSLQYVKKFFSTIGDLKDGQLDKNYAWSSPLYESAINFLTYSGDIDFRLVPYKFGVSMQKELIQMLDSVSTTSQVDILMSLVLKTFCQHMHIRDLVHEVDIWETHQANTTCEDLLLNRNVSFYVDARAGIWFSLPQTEVPIRRSYHFTLLESDLLSWVSNNPIPYYIYQDIYPLYSSITDNMSQSYLYQIATKGRGLTITIKYSVQVRARDIRPGRPACHNVTSDTCSAICTKKMTIEKCGCVPFMFKRGLTYDPELPYCNSAMYRACNLTQTGQDFKTSCSKQCQNPCEFISYSWQISHETLNPVEGTGNKSEFNLEMVPMDASFTEFTWTVKSTPEQFVSQMGGIVNFYLGLSGLSLFHFIAICVDFVYRRCYNRQKTDGEMAVMAPALNSKIRPVKKTKGNSQMENLGMHDGGCAEGDPVDVKSELFALKNQLSELQSDVRRLALKIGKQ